MFPDRLRSLFLGSLVCLLGACSSGPRPKPLPQGMSFGGKWHSNFQEMVLYQEAHRVWGTVGYRNGSLEGTADGTVLRFRWNQRDNHLAGHGFLEMTPDGGHLEGHWGYGESDNDGGRWWADRD